jgi:hypothetical protein
LSRKGRNPKNGTPLGPGGRGRFDKKDVDLGDDSKTLTNRQTVVKIRNNLT